jgi:2-polyprenyl-3-methyl-5-hydroxy-6-metoxy-1,4-benzoquinol methylase
MNHSVEARIESEIEFCNEVYRKQGTSLDVDFSLATSLERKGHNISWAYFDTVRNLFNGDLTGRRVLVCGCGVGLDALNLAKAGASVAAFDVSDEAIRICKERAAHHHLPNVDFFVAPFEELDLPHESFDAVMGSCVLHHVDIPSAIARVFDLLKPGGAGVFLEPKEVLFFEWVRSRRLFTKLFPPGGKYSYATEFERKLSRQDYAIIEARFPNIKYRYWHLLAGKMNYFSPGTYARIDKIDHYLVKALPFLRPFYDHVIMSFTKA